MRIIATAVVRNEADRYLRSCLAWNRVWWDDLFIYDDQSTDDTIAVCSEYTDKIVVRQDDIPSFMEHEGEFRSAAWQAMTEACEPTDEDFIFTLDVDEFVVGTDHSTDVRQELRRVAGIALDLNYHSVMIQIPEVWDLPTTRIRIDGFWGSMQRPDLIKFRADDSQFSNKPMGCGSGPMYCLRNPLHTEMAIAMLHYGHARAEDRVERHRRYTSLPDHGHNPRHISSIVTSAVLRDWPGQIPEVYLGHP